MANGWLRLTPDFRLSSFCCHILYVSSNRCCIYRVVTLDSLLSPRPRLPLAGFLCCLFVILDVLLLLQPAFIAFSYFGCSRSLCRVDSFSIFFSRYCCARGSSIFHGTVLVRAWGKVTRPTVCCCGYSYANIELHVRDSTSVALLLLPLLCSTTEAWSGGWRSGGSVKHQWMAAKLGWTLYGNFADENFNKFLTMPTAVGFRCLSSSAPPIWLFSYFLYEAHLPIRVLDILSWILYLKSASAAMPWINYAAFVNEIVEKLSYQNSALRSRLK